ncbi:MAG: hypothetical protein MUE44_00800 [Oscillatoriaceae cyanobacterium Prado104]|nr:hypothetical protein [Oscillatoriaceae cyanobacterium Prado104]
MSIKYLIFTILKIEIQNLKSQILRDMTHSTVYPSAMSAAIPGFLTEIRVWIDL